MSQGSVREVTGGGDGTSVLLHSFFTTEAPRTPRKLFTVSGPRLPKLSADSSQAGELLRVAAKMSMNGDAMFRALPIGFFLSLLSLVMTCSGSSSGQIGSIAISPDGRFIAVAYDKDHTSFIYKIAIDTGQATRLTGSQQRKTIPWVRLRRLSSGNRNRHAGKADKWERLCHGSQSVCRRQDGGLSEMALRLAQHASQQRTLFARPANSQAHAPQGHRAKLVNAPT
jgi:hypothetical protein